MRRVAGARPSLINPTQEISQMLSQPSALHLNPLGGIACTRSAKGCSMPHGACRRLFCDFWVSECCGKFRFWVLGFRSHGGRVWVSKPFRRRASAAREQGLPRSECEHIATWFTYLAAMFYPNLGFKQENFGLRAWGLSDPKPKFCSFRTTLGAKM